MHTLSDALLAARAIPGWMSDAELAWLAAQAAERKAIVEVGSYRGRSTKVLAMLTPGKVYSVDNLHGEVDPPPNEGAMPAQGDELDGMFRDYMAPELELGTVAIVREPSPAAAALFADGSLDMVFIDGNHVYPAPLRDIEAWQPKLAPGGLLCGHDSPDPGVARCLQEAGVTGNGPDRIWYVYT